MQELTLLYMIFRRRANVKTYGTGPLSLCWGAISTNGAPSAGFSKRAEFRLVALLYTIREVEQFR
jgi:hypothetical protein